MKRIITAAAMLLALGAIVPLTPVQAQEVGAREGAFWNETDHRLWESDN